MGPPTRKPPLRHPPRDPLQLPWQRVTARVWLKFPSPPWADSLITLLRPLLLSLRTPKGKVDMLGFSYVELYGTATRFHHPDLMGKIIPSAGQPRGIGSGRRCQRDLSAGSPDASERNRHPGLLPIDTQRASGGTSLEHSHPRAERTGGGVCGVCGGRGDC